VAANLGSDVPENIPDRAMLQPVDLTGGAAATVEDDSWARLRPPQPGAEEAYPSSFLCLRERAVSAVVGWNGTTTVVVQYVAIYESNGAHRYLRDLRRAIEASRGVDGRGVRWNILATRVAGPDSVLLLLREDVERSGETSTRETYVVAARVGRVLVVVADTGGETAAGHRGLVEELITPALRRVSVLL